MKKQQVEMPSDFILTPERIAYFRKYCPQARDCDVFFHFDKFKAFHQAKGQQFKDWDAAWRTWTMRTAEYGFKPSPISSVPFYKPAVPKNPTSEPEPTPEQRRENIKKLNAIWNSIQIKGVNEG